MVNDHIRLEYFNSIWVEFIPFFNLVDHSIRNGMEWNVNSESCLIREKRLQEVTAELNGMSNFFSADSPRVRQALSSLLLVRNRRHILSCVENL